MLNTKSILLLVTALFACSSAFVSPSSSRNTVVSRSPFSVPTPTPTATTTTTALAGRRWNFNEGQGPWGLKKNAEIWNGRVSQVRIQYDNMQYTRSLSLACWIVLDCAGLYWLYILSSCLNCVSLMDCTHHFFCEHAMLCEHTRVIRMLCTFLPSLPRSTVCITLLFIPPFFFSSSAKPNLLCICSS